MLDSVLEHALTQIFVHRARCPLVIEVRPNCWHQSVDPTLLPQGQRTELVEPSRSTLVQAVQLVPVVHFAVNSNRYRQAAPMLVVSDSERPIHFHLH
jgi:hypothetical protein